MKKFLLVFLVGALCLFATGNFLIAGGTKDKEEKAVLTFWNHPVAADTAWEAQFWEETMADFHSKYPDIQVNMEWVPWEGFWTKLVASVEAGNPPDIHHAGDFHTIAFVPDDEILPLDDLAEELGGDDAFSPLFGNYKYKGTVYALPYLEGGYIFFYNKEILKNAG